MTRLNVGFARLDITPPLGITLAGYGYIRHANGVLDPLYVTAVAFDNGEKRAVVFSVDLLGFNQKLMDRIRATVAECAQLEKEAVFICCTHTHLGPCTVSSRQQWENPDYVEFLTKKITDAAIMAFDDVVPARLLYTRGKVEGVAFVRRYRMKDGSGRTNPGYLNPDIECPIGTPDENSSLLIIKREGKAEIGIVNFQVHPDVISGCKISADFPKFVRDTYEKMVDNSLCMYINGAQGDTNHIDVTLGETELRDGYERSKYMGKKIAFSVLANYELAKEISGDRISYGQKNILAKYNKGKSEEIEEAARICEAYKNNGHEGVKNLLGLKDMPSNSVVIRATRIMNLIDKPDDTELYLTAVAVGDMVFAGFPGEPFTDVGRSIKANSKFTLTIPACCANGYEGYYPVQSAFEYDGYETSNAKFKMGTAEQLIAASTELINGL